jgi:putative spermidine/putrescine transport system substrate-binding protein
MKFRFCFGVAAVVLVVASCSPNQSPRGQVHQPPTANLKPLDNVRAGEQQLNLIALEGYVDDAWVKTFREQTGCQVNAHYAVPSEMLNLMRDGGGGQWDMVSATGDIALSLIYGGDVRPMNEKLIPEWANFQTYFKNAPYNTISGVHYGISLQWGPNALLYNSRKFPNKPTSWSVIYDSSHAQIITITDNPMQIADAAAYLSKAQPRLGITDPYELTKSQFDAAVALLMQQRPLVKQYWAVPQQAIDLFTRGDVMVGVASPYETIALKAAKVAVDETIPDEGATGWGDTWMLATKAQHPNCAYLWTAYVSTAHVQALQALTFGETPVNSRACAEMEAQSPGSCAQYHADVPASYFEAIKFWKTPLTTCDGGSENCIPYEDWVTAWMTIKG